MSAGRYIDIPGSQTHELPPLLVHWAAEHAAEQRGYDLESMMAEAEDMLAAGPTDQIDIEQRKFELALQLAEQYKGLVAHWSWGDSVLEWIRQCEITFESEGCCASCCIRMSGRMPAARASWRCCSRKASVRRASRWIAPSACALRFASRRPWIAFRANFFFI